MWLCHLSRVLYGFVMAWKADRTATAAAAAAAAAKEALTHNSRCLLHEEHFHAAICLRSYTQRWCALLCHWLHLRYMQSALQ
jgi:hypothetical protein